MLEEKQYLKISKEFGTPVYTFEEVAFLQNYQNLLNTFRKVYPKYNIGYSYKTNYTPYVCKLIKKLGGYAEVVSDMEYELAVQLGYCPNMIIYNGPCKGEKLKYHILHQGITNIDNEEEAGRIVLLANENPTIEIKVGLRMNIDIGAGYISRFGIDENKESIAHIAGILSSANNIRIVGLHCHISRARGIDSWRRRIDNLISIADRYINGTPEYIDVGSGMFGEMDDSLLAQFGLHVPNYEEYAEVVAGAMQDRYGIGEDAPLLFSEPGTTVIAKYFSLITKVDNIRAIKGKNFATMDSSYYNTGEICLMKKLPYMVIKGKNHDKQKVGTPMNIMGFTCLEQDVLYSEFSEELAKDDLIVFGNVGGYSIVSKPPFIRPNCSVVAVQEDGSFLEIKRKEKFEDVFATFLM